MNKNRFYVRLVKRLFRLNEFRRAIEKKKFSRHQAVYDRDLSFSKAVITYPEPNSLYAYMHHYFHHRCPQIVRDHREYFKQEQRGFGEDAFHAMWWLLLLEYRPVRMLEIGVYRGQVISLWALLSKYLHRPYEVHGISPFSSRGDSVSSYLRNLDYMTDILETFDHCELSPPVLVKALSTDSKAVAHIQSQTWDLIYIDGSHDYEVVLADYRLSREHLRSGGLLVLDDASVGTSFRPPPFSFAGHPGPSRVAREYADHEMEFLGAVGHNNVFLKA